VWEELHGGQASSEYTAVREDMLAVKAEAVELLGTDPGEEQLEEALRSHTETVVDTSWARQALAEALHRVGVAADLDDQADLEQLAEQWLAQQTDTGRRNREVEDRLQDLEQELTAARGDLSSQKENDFFGADSQPEPAADDPLAALQAAIDNAAAAEADAEQALEQARSQAADRAGQAGDELRRLETASDEARAAADEARRRLEESETALEAARRAAQDAADAVAAAAAAAQEAATAPVEAAQSEPEPEAEPEAAAPPATASVLSIEAELYLLARIAAARSARLPLVVADAFADLPPSAQERMHRILDRSADGVQVLYLSASPDVAGWVGGLGDRAALAAS
jgi:trimeric autotransporter adhesin